MQKEGDILLANRLKILLAERDLSIKDLMNATGLSRNSLSNMVNNPMANIATDNIDKLCNYLEVSPKEFFDYSGWRFNFEFNSNNKENPSLSITMTSGKMTRNFSLFFRYDFIDSGDPNNGAAEDYSMIFAENPNGFDKYFVDVYQQLSPLFQHQVENQLISAAKKVFEIYDGNTTPCFFNYDFNDDVIFEAKLQ